MDFLILVVIFAVGFFLLRIFIAPLQKSQMIKDREREQAEARAKAREEKLEQKKEALARQKALEDKYFNSPLTRRIIEAISDDTGRLPEEITVFDSRVTGRTNSQMRDFDFAANRVPFLDGLYTIEGEYVKSAHNPKEALAHAINLILGEQYNIEHSGTNHVLLRLKATNHW